MTSLTLIIPMRGRLPLVERTLASVATQTRKPDRLIIVDNGNSPADLAALRVQAERLGQTFSVDIISCSTPGAPAARNAALEVATTEWTMFFDSDDIMLPTHIASACACAEQNPEADIIGWDAVLVNSTGRELRRKKFPTSHHLYHAIMHGSLATQCYMARTDLFRHAGGWNPQARIWNDVELSVRLLAHGPRIIKLTTKEPPVRILVHSDSITGANFSTDAAGRDHTLSLLQSLTPDNPEGESFTAILALKRAILAARCRREGRTDLARDLYRRTTEMPISHSHRLLVRFAYHYTALSLPGAARLLLPFFT